MSRFIIRIAGQNVEIETLYVRPLVICKDFITEGAPTFRVCTTQKDIDFEKERYKAIYNDDPDDRFLEVTAVFRKLSDEMVDYNAFVIHGAVVAVDNKAYLFTGRSGIGKSTHVFKWRRNIPGAQIINGDKPFIMMGDIPMACGSPWTGKEGIYTNIMVPLKAIVLLERAEENKIKQIPFTEAFPTLYQQIYRPKDVARMKKTLQMLKKLEHDVSFYRFEMNNYKNDCFQVAYDMLVGRCQ